MLKGNGDGNKTKDLLKISTEVRRNLQYKVLKEWDKGNLTARQTIENIVEVEKIIFLKKEDITGVKDGTIPGPENG